LTVEFDDEETFAGEIVAFGDAIRVDEPADLRAAVVRRLKIAAGVGA
jgi:predicted DNA-binding transcriptional regulator YafY